MPEIISQIIDWTVSFALGAVSGYIIMRFKVMKHLVNGTQCLLRLYIIDAHDKYTEKGYCPVYAKEALTRAYQSYHNLGGNDVATELYHQAMALPTEPPERN